MQGLYVDSSDAGVSLPVGSISADEATTLIGMAEARLEMERSIDFDAAPSQERHERAVWLFEATSDPERRALIMGHKSMQKLAELGSTSAWVMWLKETFERHEVETRALIEREMRRAADDPATAHDKWLITVRVYTDSNSIRQKALNKWNQDIRWIKLRAVSGKKDQLFLDLSATSEVRLENVWRMGLTMARRVWMRRRLGSSTPWIGERGGIPSSSRGPAPQLQVPLVAGPRNQLNRHEKVARFRRPFRFLGSSQHRGQVPSQLDPESPVGHQSCAAINYCPALAATVVGANIRRAGGLQTPAKSPLQRVLGDKRQPCGGTFRCNFALLRKTPYVQEDQLEFRWLIYCKTHPEAFPMSASIRNGPLHASLRGKS